MASCEDVRRLALALPETSEAPSHDGLAAWRVKDTTPHFDGFPAVLVRLDHITVADLQELIVEAWLDEAPKRLAKQYVAER